MTEKQRYCDFKDHWLDPSEFDPRGRGLYRQCRRCRLEQRAAKMLGAELVPIEAVPEGCVRLPDGLIVEKGLANRSIINQELFDKILVAAGECTSIHSIYQAVGISHVTWWKWRNDTTREPFKTLNEEIDKIRARDKEALLANMRRIAIGDDASAVRATEFILKKVYHEEFGDKVVHDITHRRGKDEIDYSNLTDAEVLQLHALHTKALEADNDATS